VLSAIAFVFGSQRFRHGRRSLEWDGHSVAASADQKGKRYVAISSLENFVVHHGDCDARFLFLGSGANKLLQATIVQKR
jgi:hypothetical protein